MTPRHQRPGPWAEPPSSRPVADQASLVPVPEPVLLLPQRPRARGPRGGPCDASGLPAPRRCSKSGFSPRCRASRTVRESPRWRDPVLSLVRRRGLWMPQVRLTLEGRRLIESRTQPRRPRETDHKPTGAVHRYHVHLDALGHVTSCRSTAPSSGWGNRDWSPSMIVEGLRFASFSAKQGILGLGDRYRANATTRGRQQGCSGIPFGSARGSNRRC